MVKVVFVHGINQQGKTPESLCSEWLGALSPALAKSGYAGDALTPATPFYGDVLFELSSARNAAVSAQGPGAVSDGEAEFLAEGLEEIAAKDERVDGNEVAAEAEEEAVLEQGLLKMDRRVNAIARVLERISPFHGDITSRLLRQAYVYLRQPGAAEQIDARVAPHFSEGPCVIIAHSLGTVVSFKLLRRMALEGRPLEVPLFLTLGSPLSLRTVRKALGPSFAPPKGVGRWLNAYDKDDFVALGQGLTRSTFAEGIENWGEVANTRDDAHGIAGYLCDPKVVASLLSAL